MRQPVETRKSNSEWEVTYIETFRINGEQCCVERFDELHFHGSLANFKLADLKSKQFPDDSRGMNGGDGGDSRRSSGHSVYLGSIIQFSIAISTISLV